MYFGTNNDPIATIPLAIMGIHAREAHYMIMANNNKYHNNILLWYVHLTLLCHRRGPHNSRYRPRHK